MITSKKYPVTMSVSELLEYAYSDDCELRGHIVCANDLLVWNHYIDSTTVHVWSLVQGEFEQGIEVELDTPKSELDDYRDAVLYTNPRVIHENVSTVHDFLNIASVYA